VQGKWLRQVVTGYFNYHAVPTNSPALTAFRFFVTELWQRTLRRRSQKDGMTWGKDYAARQRLAPQTANPSPLAASALRRHTPEVGAVCGNPARTVLCGGLSNERPYREWSAIGPKGAMLQYSRGSARAPVIAITARV
jgi:RNA-directed DNA polymerase